ncbi:MAG: CBS domain-containing protein [Bacteroidetes bacterium]|nr:CBS domain-containing protein [Bacteroidota bacterium]MBX7044746.1 CBS domain-containing protein [Ignavibacteria bacterium]
MTSVKDLIKKDRLHFVKSGMTVADVAKFMDMHNVGAVPVLKEGNKLAGIFSERDLLRRCAAKELDLSKTLVDDVMTKGVILIEAHDTPHYCLQIMKQENIRHILVRENTDLIGMLSIRDIMYHDMQEKEEKIELLNSYIQFNG